jgi:hypothetical protein
MAQLRSKVNNISGRRLTDILPGFGFEGDWVSAKELLETAPAKVKKAVRLGQIQFAKLYKEALVSNIDSNGSGLGWAAVSPGYAAFKSGKGQSPTSLYDFYGYLKRNIKVHTFMGSDRVEIGIKKGVRNSMNKGSLDVSQYAAVLEMGSTIRNIQARPLFRPTFKQIGGQTKIKALILLNITNTLKIKHGIL